MKLLRSQVSSSSNISSKVGEDQRGAEERQFRISSDGLISSRLGEDQKQAKEHQLKVFSKGAEECPVNEKADIDRSVMIIESDNVAFAGVKWKLVSFGKKNIILGKRSIMLTQYPGSDKWVVGECWLQGQYTKDNCAVTDGMCTCKSEIYSRNFEDWTLEDTPCVADWPPGPIQIGTHFTAAPPNIAPMNLIVTDFSKLDDYGQHPDGCPLQAIMGTGEANRKKFKFLWKDGDLLVLSPGFICKVGFHMENSILEGSSRMCNDAEVNCRFGMVDSAALTCNTVTKEWENFPTCVAD
jgi:hypothetical protein